MVDRKQDIVRGIPKCYNGSAQLVQQKQPHHHREEAVTGVVYTSTPQSQDLLIDPSTWCLTLHTTLTMRDSIVFRLVGKNNERHPEGDTEDGIESTADSVRS